MSVLKEFTNVMASAGERKSGDYSFQWKKFRKSGNFNGVAETTPQLRFFIGQETVPLDFTVILITGSPGVPAGHTAAAILPNSGQYARICSI